MFFNTLIFILTFVHVFSNTYFTFAETYLYPLKFILFIFIFVLVLFSKILVGRKTIRLSKSTVNISFFFSTWIIAILISLSRTRYPLSGLLIAVSYILLFLASFVLLPNFVVRENAWLRYQSALFWCILISIVISILLGLGKLESFYVVGNRIRYRSFFINPNYLGGFSTLGFMTSIVISTARKKKIYLFPVPFYLILIYLSKSRASLLWVAVFLVTLFYLKVKNKTEKFLSKIFILFSLSLIIIVLVYAINYFHFMDKSYVDELSSYRLSLWLEGMNNKSNYELFFGQGLGSESFSSMSYDNYYVNILVQTGLLGLFTFLSFIFAVSYYFYKKLNHISSNEIAIVFFAMFIGLIVYSFFESVLFSLGNLISIYIWMNVGCLMGAVDYQKRVPHVPVVAKITNSSRVM